MAYVRDEKLTRSMDYRHRNQASQLRKLNRNISNGFGCCFSFCSTADLFYTDVRESALFG